jgi:aryl-alcohol dehydrogenase (NADP+)
MTFGLQVDEPSSFAILDHGREGHHVPRHRRRAIHWGDPATGGERRNVGKWMKGKREQYVVANPRSRAHGTNPWDMGNSRRHIMDSIDAPLRRSDRLHRLYQLHFDDRGVPLKSRSALTTRPSGQGPLRRMLELPAYRPRLHSRQERATGIARFDSVQPRYNRCSRVRARRFPLCPRRASA